MAATAGPFNARSLGVYVGNVLQAYSRSCSLTLNGTVIDITTKDSSLWRSVLMGTKDWTITCDGLLAVDSSINADKLGDYLIAGTSAVVKFATHITGDKYWYGTAYVSSITMNAGNDEPATYSATFQGTGALTSTVKT